MYYCTGMPIWKGKDVRNSIDLILIWIKEAPIYFSNIFISLLGLAYFRPLGCPLKFKIFLAAYWDHWPFFTQTWVSLNQLNTEKSRRSGSIGSPHRTKTCPRKVRLLGGHNKKRYDLETPPKVSQVKVDQIQKINISFYSCGLFIINHLHILGWKVFKFGHCIIILKQTYPLGDVTVHQQF